MVLLLHSARAFNLATLAFNLATRAFSLLTREFELVTREFELVTHEFQLLKAAMENLILLVTNESTNRQFVLS